ncbi:MAG: T9SS type A sorting domain-containing protein [Bacteroidota bacterium]|jgi:PKD repeat protein
MKTTLTGLFACIIMMCFAPSSSKGQTLPSNYTFTQFSQSYSPITGGTLHGTPTNDDQIFSAIPLGFFIAYNGASYNSIGISPNGYIWFGTNPTGNTYTPISTTAASSGIISALGRNLESRSAAGGGELRSQLQGTAPNRIFTIQWKNYQRFSSGTSDNGDIFNFQIRLFEYNQSIEIVYGNMTASANGTAQVGLRGNINTNFMNRIVNSTNLWNASIAGGVNTASVSYTTSRLPIAGQTYKWTPTSLLNTSINGGAVDTTSSYNGDQVSTSTTSTATVSSEGGINSLGIQRFVNGASQPWAAMTKLSGDDTSGTWQIQVPTITQSADVVYIYRIINPSRFFLFTDPIAFEVNYLRNKATDDVQIADNAQGNGINLSAQASVTNVKITELILDAQAGGCQINQPFTTNPNAQYFELTNLASANASLGGFVFKTFDETGQVHELTFPEPFELLSGDRIVIATGGSNGQQASGNSQMHYFELGGDPLTSSIGIALYNPHGEIMDAVSLNGFRFPASSGVRIVHWYGQLNTSACGLSRLTMTDHNNQTDWGSEISSMGNMNPGLSSTATPLVYQWHSPDINGWTATGREVQLPVLSTGSYKVYSTVQDNGYAAADSLVVTIYGAASPDVDFSATLTQPYPMEVVTLLSSTTNFPDSLRWTITPGSHSYANGTSAQHPNAVVNFQTPGFYTISLQAYNSSGVGSKVKTDFIEVLPFVGNCVKPTGVTISNITTNSALVTWNRGYFADSMQVRYQNLQGQALSLNAFSSTNQLLINNLSSGTSYGVRIKPWCNGAPSDDFTARVSFVTNGARLSMDDPMPAIAFHPNPAAPGETLHFTSTESSEQEVALMDLAGRICYRALLHESGQLNLPSNLKPGVYMLSVKSEGYNSIHRFVIR